MPKIKRSVLKKKCITVGTITTLKGLKWLTAPQIPADVVEVRVDALRAAGMEVDAIHEKLSQRKHPTLLTLRTMVEGGVYPWKSTECILVFEQLLKVADAIDLEVRNMKYVRPILQQARDAKKTVILSTHALERKLTAGKADRLIREFRSYLVDVYKLAALARSDEDLKVLVQTLLKYPQLRLAMMATGPMAQVSRTVLPALGSKLVYGYLDEPAAEGQPSIKEVCKMLEVCGVL